MSILSSLALIKSALRLSRLRPPNLRLNWSAFATWATTPSTGTRRYGRQVTRRYVERRTLVQLTLNNAEFGLCSRCGTPRIGSTVMDVGVVVCPASGNGGRHDPPRHYRTARAR